MEPTTTLGYGHVQDFCLHVGETDMETTMISFTL